MRAEATRTLVPPVLDPVRFVIESVQMKMLTPTIGARYGDITDEFKLHPYDDVTPETLRRANPFKGQRKSDMLRCNIVSVILPGLQSQDTVGKSRRHHAIDARLTGDLGQH